MRFPLGDFTKSTIRDLAKYFDLNVAEKPDSQDICFIPDGDYKKFIKSNKKKGEILDLSGNVLSFHDGIQRRGFVQTWSVYHGTSLKGIIFHDLIVLENQGIEQRNPISKRVILTKICLFTLESIHFK